MRRRADRWISMAELAQLFDLKNQNPRHRRQYVRRLIRGLEKRDGRAYLQRFSDTKGKLWIAVSTVERLLPWDAGTLSALRRDVDSLGGRIVRAEGKIEKHGRKLETHDNALMKVGDALQAIVLARA